MPFQEGFALKNGVRSSLSCESIHITSIISYQRKEVDNSASFLSIILVY